MADREGTKTSGGPTGRSERRRAVMLAGHRGDATTARAHVADNDPSVRVAALGALLRAGDLRAADLAAGLIDPAPSVRIRAAELVAQLEGSGPASEVSLLPLLDDTEPTVVEVAAWACGERVRPESGAVDHLARLVRHADDALVREAAVAALGAIGDPAGLTTVLVAMGDRATVRRRAVIALAPFDGPEVAAALTAALMDRDWQVRQAAEDLGAEPATPAATDQEPTSDGR